MTYPSDPPEIKVRHALTPGLGCALGVVALLHLLPWLVLLTLLYIGIEVQL